MTKKEIQGSGKEINPTLLEKDEMDNAFTKMMLGQKRIEEAYCSFETAKLLKEKGFDECIFEFYVGVKIKYARNGEGFKPSELPNICYPHITHQMACAWLREKGYHIAVLFNSKFRTWERIIQASTGIEWSLGGFSSHDEAVEEGIKYALENLI